MKRDALHRFLIDPLVGVGVWLGWTLFSCLPLKVAGAFGEVVGLLIAPFMRARNRVALRNLEIAFPMKTLAERQKILRGMWRHFGRFFAEMPHSQEWVNGAEIEGKEFLAQTKADGVGGFVCSAHLGNWELASNYVAQRYYALHPVYRPANNKWIEKIMFKGRAGTLIPKGSVGVRIMLDLLKQGEHIAILCDQRLREGIPAPLFGKTAMTPSAMVALSLKMKVPILMGKSIRMPDGHFKMTVFPLEMSQAEDTDIAIFETVTRINQILEGWICENPEQWLWVHRRFDKSEYK